MSALDNLISISSDATGTGLSSVRREIPQGISDLLAKRDGFCAFESSLEVFSLSIGRGYSVSEWNSDDLWKSSYGNLSPKGVCFAQDIFGGQYVFGNGIEYFDPETAEFSEFAVSLEEWASRILEEFEIATGQPIAHDWQKANGAISLRHRLVPLTPFVLGGDYGIDNLIAMESAKSMRLRANLALQICNLPDGAQISYDVTE